MGYKRWNENSSSELIIREALERLAMSDQGMDALDFNEDSTPRLSRPASMQRYTLEDRLHILGIDVEAARLGLISRVESGSAWAVFDPYGMNGFLLRAGATMAGDVVDIGFDTRGKYRAFSRELPHRPRRRLNGPLAHSFPHRMISAFCQRKIFFLASHYFQRHMPSLWSI